ncbi:MAG: DUF1015 domain-containing protein [Clostridia bacterium]|nr:DUF1015 domain-containing protein [Clostridia bacterium]
MAEIRAFRALRFTEAAGPLAEVVCPPYDIISEEQRREYLARNANNIIRLELPREGADPYAVAGEVLERMLAEGVLKQDDTPALYVYDIEFALEDGTHNVYGMVAQLHLEEFSKGIVLPHEETLSKAKQDRLNLMKATACNFSDVYGLYNDEGMNTYLAAAMQGEPLCAVTDEAGLTHRLWAITEPEVIAAIQARFADTKLYIADGHHRYETAINYRNWLRENGTPAGTDADYIMMMMVEMSHPGLVVQPTHRLLRDLSNFDPAALLESCRARFEVEEALPLSAIEERLAAAYGEGKRAFGFYTGGDTAALLTLRDLSVMDTELPALSEASRRLDVNVLHTLILEQLLGIDKANMAQQINLTYTRSFTEAIDVVANGTFQGAFLLNPTRVSEIRDVAAAGEKMPQKSTYFYPKLITGLTVNRLK